ncbi:DUF262 domain-containing protein [Flavobacteriales bacterium]|nr:DUF262 domain-containing protein [Flavobacteriales bacterium]
MELRQILDGVESLEMVMPEFQREYVWPIEDAKQLFVSMFNAYPTGCLLFWETENPPEIKNKAVDTSKLGLTKVILDGQQRLTTLFMIIRGEIPPYYTVDDILNDPRHLYIDVLNGEFQFYSPKRMNNNPIWRKVTDCFNEELVDSHDIADEYRDNIDEECDWREVSKTIAKNLSKLRAIEKMTYPILTVPKTATIDDAIDVFDRVNSKGTKLTDAELVLTHITGGWPKARRVLKDKLFKLKELGFEFNLDFLTRCMVVTLTDSALFKKNSKLKYDNFNQEDYINSWNKVSKALDYLIPVLQQDALISSTNDLSTNNVLVPIISYLVNNDNRFKGKMKYQFLYWMFLSLIWRRYSGQTDARLDKDIHIINRGNDIIFYLVKEIEDDRGRLDVKETDMEGRTAGHPLYKMLYIVTKYNKAIDWSNGGSIYGTIGDYYSIQSHHIFPQAYLYRNGYDSVNAIHKKQVNEIANRAFITRDTNYEISDKSPFEYLPEIQSNYPNALNKQFIPQDQKLWNAESYPEFLKQRRIWIADEMNKFLEMLRIHEGDSVSDVLTENEMSWEDIFRKKEDNFTEFKSSLLFCYREKKHMNYIEHEVLKTIDAFLNAEGGMLLIGVDDDGNVLGLDEDLKLMGNKGKDGLLLRFDTMIINALGKEQKNDIMIRFESHNDKEFIVVEVSQSNKPIFMKFKGKEEFYVRHAASSRSYSMSEAADYINKHFK